MALPRASRTLKAPFFSNSANAPRSAPASCWAKSRVFASSSGRVSEAVSAAEASRNAGRSFKSGMGVFYHICIVIAVSPQDALVTPRLARAAHFAPVPDEIEVRGVIRFGRQNLFKMRMSLFHRHLLRA